jgi:putative membrane protein insertion efficiency factor
MAKINAVVIQVLCFCIHVYQYCLSNLFPKSCRFFPSCSSYALEAIQKKGPFKGILMIIARLMRCHPWNPGGYDPVEPN